MPRGLINPRTNTVWGGRSDPEGGAVPSAEPQRDKGCGQGAGRVQHLPVVLSLLPFALPNPEAMANKVGEAGQTPGND